MLKSEPVNKLEPVYCRVWNRNCRLPKLSQQWQLRLDTNKIQNVILVEKVDLEALLLPKFLGIYLAFLWFLCVSAASLREVDDWSKKAKCSLFAFKIVIPAKMLHPGDFLYDTADQ